MKRWIALLLGICLALGMVAASAEDENTGTWYFIYAGVTIGELDLNGDSSYQMSVYSQEEKVTGTWSRDDAIISLSTQNADPTRYVIDGTQLIPVGFKIDFEIRREPGRITDGQLNEYIASGTLPDGVSEEDMEQIIQDIYDATDAIQQAGNTFGEFTGVWDNGAGGYLTIWGTDLTASFIQDGELNTGFFGNYGEWTREGNALVNTDGTLIVLKEDGSMLCSENSGTYVFTKAYDLTDKPADPATADFTGIWKGTGILLTDPTGVKVFSPIEGYELQVGSEKIVTLLSDDINAYPYNAADGKMTFDQADGKTAELVLHEDGSLRWVVSDSLTTIFRKADPGEATALYSVSGPGYVPAGSSAAFAVTELIGQRVFTWSVEGEGVSVDPETGAVTVAEDAESGQMFTVMATPDDGGAPATAAASVCSALLGDETIDTVTRSYGRGFAIPVINGWGTPLKVESKDDATIQYQYDTDQFTVTESCSFVGMDGFPDAAEYYQMIRNNLMGDESYRDVAEKVIDIDGSPVYTICFATENGEQETGGYIYSIRDNSMFLMALLCTAKGEIPVRITQNDLEKIAQKVTYTASDAPLRKADGELTLSAQWNQEVVSAGKKVAFTASFANPGAVKREKADALTWTLIDTDTGEAPEGITLDEKGTLIVSKDLTATKHVEITVASEFFGTKASYAITAVPVIRGLVAEPKEVILYTNSDDEAVIRVKAEPDIIPEGLEWTLKPKGIADIIPSNSIYGDIKLKPAEAGKGTMTATEPGGKTVSIKVTVINPVESMQLSMSGHAAPGATVKFAADLKPNNAGNRSVKWSLDVGEDIATINDYGRLKINRSTPVGTEITVTCTASGAKEPIRESMKITVEEKK